MRVFKDYKDYNENKNDGENGVSQEFLHNCRTFNRMQKDIESGKRRKRGPLVVLSLFAGITTYIVILKQLKIAIKTEITVKHDQVAEYVGKYNHDPAYNHLLPQNEIEYVYKYKNFEKIEDEFRELDTKALLKEFGPIYLIL